MLHITSTKDAITTGMKEVSEALNGGIRRCSLVLIEGDAKSGKSVLSQHFAHGALFKQDNAVVYYTMDNTPDELIAQMGSMSLYVEHNLAVDRFRVYPIGSGSPSQKAGVSIQLLVNHITELPERFNLVVVDSVTKLLLRLNPAGKMDFLQSCKVICKQGRSIILAVDNHVFEGKLLLRAYSMSDYYLRLRSCDALIGPGQMDDRVIKILEVTKVGGAESRAQQGIKFEIKPKTGIQILPFVTIKV